jgi:hypothetical protein
MTQDDGKREPVNVEPFEPRAPTSKAGTHPWIRKA